MAPPTTCICAPPGEYMKDHTLVRHDGRWYRSGRFGPSDYWKLGFTEVERIPGRAFRVVEPAAASRAGTKERGGR